jgi:hypothetical protein
VQAPPLSYSLPAFRPGDCRDHRIVIDDLVRLGFPCVTFTPTYLVYDETELRIDVSRGPAMDELRTAVAYAFDCRLQVRIEPHLDFESTLTGGAYDWRRRMYFSPLGAYAGSIVYPLARMLEGTAGSLTLGSELDVSVADFAEDWLVLRRNLDPALSAGHKLNPDSLGMRSAIREVVNAERTRRGAAAHWVLDYQKRVRNVLQYIADLDWVSFSFYPDMRMDMSDEWWRSETTGEQLRELADGFADRVRPLHTRFRNAVGERTRFAIGEFGIGSPDPTRPYHFDAAAFTDEGSMQVRRKYYRGFLRCLLDWPDLFEEQPVCFWTVGQFDFLGVLRQKGFERFRDETLIRAVESYNRLRLDAGADYPSP